MSDKMRDVLQRMTELCAEAGLWPKTAAEARAMLAEQICRTDGRCQYAIDHGAEGIAACPKGKCALPAQAEQLYTMDQMRDYADAFHQSRLKVTPSAQAEQSGEVAYWAAVDSDGTLQMTMNADDGNGGMAARQEVNDWINEAIADGGPAASLVALYTAPPAPVVPDGWKLVPLEPTMRMIRSFNEGRPMTLTDCDVVKSRYAAMLAAAPTVAAPDVKPFATVDGAFLDRVLAAAPEVPRG